MRGQSPAIAGPYGPHAMGATPARDTNEAAATRDAEARPEPSVAELAPAPAAAPAGAVGVPPIDPRYASQAQSLLARRMLAMQAHAGNAATQRLARQAAPGGLATSQAESIARRLEDAMSGWGTDEEAIYGALSGRTAADMVVIRQAYQRLFSENLDAELRDELNDEELARVTQMMAPVADESAQTEREQQVAAMNRGRVIVEQLVDAMEGLGTEEDQIFNALMGRTREEVREIRAQYRVRTGRPLEYALADELSGGELQRALGLLGVASEEFENRITQEMTEGKTTVVRGRFHWTLTQDALEVYVPIAFDPDDDVSYPFQEWQSEVDSIWNKFVVTESGGRELPIIMEMGDDSSGYHHIDVVENETPGKYSGSDRANAGMWYPAMKEWAVPHEFGHLIGLPDEYQRSHADFTEITGEVKTGPTNESEKTEAEIAAELHEKLTSEPEESRGLKARLVLVQCGLIKSGTAQQGDFAQAVRAAYDEEYGDLFDDINDLPKGSKWRLLTVFSFASSTVMGDWGEMGQHKHPVQKRHMREFLAIVQRTWPAFQWRLEDK